MSSEEEVLDGFHFEPGGELRGWVVVVLDRVAWPRHVRALESRHRVEELELHGDGQGSGQAVHVQLGGIEPFGFQEDLMALGLGELDDLILDRRTVARPAPADRAAVQRRLFQVALNDLLHFCAGPGDPARHLARPLRVVVEGEVIVPLISVLARDFGPIDRPPVDARRGASLEARYRKSTSRNDFREFYRRLIARPAGGNLRVQSEVDAAPQERARCDDYGAGAEPAPIRSLHAADPLTVEEQICDHALRQLEGGEALEQVAYRSLVEGAIALRPRSPDRRTFGAIEHAELDRGTIGGAAHETAEGVYLADNGALGDAADGGIAGQLADGFEVGGKEEGVCPEPR